MITYEAGKASAIQFISEKVDCDIKDIYVIGYCHNVYDLIDEI